jgi:hypothetical protein
MNFLKSYWTAAILVIVLNLSTTVGLVLLQSESLRPVVQPGPVEQAPLFWSFSGVEVDKMVFELQSERKELEARESDLEKVAAQIAAEREELKTMRGDIESARNQLSTAIVEIQEAEVKNLKSLALTYSSMAASSAVPILCEMDEKMAVKILAQMKADKSGAIFQEMARTQSPDGTLVKRAAHMADLLRLLKPNKPGAQKL